jgi:hypothetical protein
MEKEASVRTDAFYRIISHLLVYYTDRRIIPKHDSTLASSLRQQHGVPYEGIGLL